MNDLSNMGFSSNENAMNKLDVIGIVDAMQKRLLARVNLSDVDYAEVVDNKLELEALQSIGEELRGASEAESVSLLIKRVARLEARFNALSRVFHRLEAKLDSQGAPTPPAEQGGKVILMDEDVVQIGFYPAERTESGVSFRWLGPEPIARVHLPKIKHPLKLTLAVAAVYSGIRIEAVRVALNDGEWASVEVARADGWTTLRCRPEPGPNRDGLVDHIDIDCGATFCPAEQGGSDLRQIGIALSRIEMVSV
jgi:hypothetical protein